MIFKRKPVDLVASEIEAMEKRQPEKTTPKMLVDELFDHANQVLATGGWCAPSSTTHWDSKS